MNLLVVEDNIDMLKFLKGAFHDEGFTVDTAEDGLVALQKIQNSNYDIIILDNHLPYKNGKEVCAEIRRMEKNARVVILSVRGEVETKVDMLNIGADDYVTKPFVFSELIARVRAVLRRPEQVEKSTLTIGDITLDPIAHTVHKNKKEIHLTRKEFNFLHYLMRNQGRTVSRMSILEHVWGGDADPFTNTVETHVVSLRKKIKGKTKQSLIHTVSGVGYKIAE